MNIVQGIGGGKSRFKLFFDAKTGLLTRQVHYEDTLVGTVPIQVDYSDYRDVGGVKTPFHVVITWTDGQSIIQLNDVQANAAIDPAIFAKPAPAKVKSASKRQ